MDSKLKAQENKPVKRSIGKKDKRFNSLAFLSLNLFAILICLFTFNPFLNAAQEDPFPQQLEGDLSRGTSALYRLEFPIAERHFRHAIELRPDHPAPYFFLVMLTWYRLTYDDLLARDHSLEQLLEQQAETVVHVSKQFAKKREGEAVAHLYWGGALGVKGWHHVIRGQWIRAYFSGKKAYANVQKAIELNPELYDAYLGIGMYEYHAATLGPTLKALASFSIRGDKEKALGALRIAKEKSRYVKQEASYFLWFAELKEKRLEDALQKANELIQTFPYSPLFEWCKIQTLFEQGKWEEVLKAGEPFRFLAKLSPQPEGVSSPYQLLLSKVDYHCGVAARNLRKLDMAERYFEEAIAQAAAFGGWKALSTLHLGEILELEGNRSVAMEKYRKVLELPDFSSSHAHARQRLRAHRR